MLQHPTSQAVLRCQGTSPAPIAPSPELLPPRRSSLTDGLILALLAEHEVLTTTQVVSLLALPERTVQHRLGCLYGSGLVNRLRPEASIGTSPYHYWLTASGATAAGAEQPDSWSDNPGGMRATALLTELWLSVKEQGAASGMHLHSWRRLRSGVEYHDAGSGTLRWLAAEAELTVTLGRRGDASRAFVVARIERVPAARLVALLGRFAGNIASRPIGEPCPALIVLARNSRVASGVLAAGEQLVGASVLGHLDRTAVEAAMRRVAVGVAEPYPRALATDAVWSTLVGGGEQCLGEILSAAEAERASS
jgi:hypothetical protein